MSDPNASSIPLIESSTQHDRVVVEQLADTTTTAAITITSSNESFQLPVDLQPSAAAAAASASAASAAGPHQQKIPSNVVAVFIARFDVTSGNTIEWQFPEEIDLSGVEYQAICSGLHKIEADTIYFTKSPYFGVGLYQKDDAGASERGAIMRSVGILLEPTNNSGPCAKAWVHSQALRSLNPFASTNHLRKTLRTYYDQHQLHHEAHHKKATTTSTWEYNPMQADNNNDNHLFDPEALLYDTHLPYVSFDRMFSVAPYPLEPLPLLSSLPMFIAHLGPQVFVLWKAAVLRKRILFLTEPPMSRAAGYVYDTYLLGTFPDKYQPERAFTPKYTISVNDIPDLVEYRDGFVASTSDSIFETKTEMYDVLIKLPKATGYHLYQKQQLWISEPTPAIHSTCPEIGSRHNAADLIRFRSIVRQLFDTARDMGFAGDMDAQLGDALERKSDAMDAISMAMFQLTLWWFRPSPTKQSRSDIYSPSNASRSKPAWQRIFAGSTQSEGSTRCHSGQHRKRQGRHTLLENIPMNHEEQEQLLLGDNNSLEDDEQDATELSNNEVFHVVTARTSSSSTQPDQEPPPQATATVQEKLTGALVGFFHTLTRQTLSRLDFILSCNASDENGVVPIYPRDMIQLGLHPHLDADFVTELAYMYFDKHARVVSSINASCTCCCGPTEGTLRI